MVAATKEKEEAVSVDEQFLLDYVARGGKAQLIESEKEIDKENVDEFLRERVAEQKTTELKSKLQKRAEKQGAADDERLEREKAQEEQKRAAALEKQREKEEADRLTQSQKLRKAAGNAAHQVGQSVQPALDKVASLHTVGGIGLLLLVLLILVFTIVPANAAGDTRLKLLWAMLNGNAHLIGRAQVGGGATGGTTGNPISGVGAAAQPTSSVSALPNSPIVPLSNGTFRQLP